MEGTSPALQEYPTGNAFQRFYWLIVLLFHTCLLGNGDLTLQGGILYYTSGFQGWTCKFTHQEDPENNKCAVSPSSEDHFSGEGLWYACKAFD